MSFSGNLREELARIIPSGRKARETAAAALLINIGELVPGENGRIFLVLSVEIPQL